MRVVGLYFCSKNAGREATPEARSFLTITSSRAQPTHQKREEVNPASPDSKIRSYFPMTMLAPMLVAMVDPATIFQESCCPALVKSFALRTFRLAQKPMRAITNT